MFQPQFPFTGDQIILSSERILLHAKNDAVFLFGKQAVSLSSTKTINLDAPEKVLIFTNKIELGNDAEVLGEPVILGRSMITQLSVLLSNLQSAGEKLGSVAEGDLGGSFQKIREAGDFIKNEASRLKTLLQDLNTPVLSKTTFTR